MKNKRSIITSETTRPGTSLTLFTGFTALILGFFLLALASIGANAEQSTSVANLSSAQQERVTLIGDGVFSFDGKKWLAVGGVTLVQGDTTITADRMVVETDSDEALMEGNVLIVRGDEQMTGERLTYDLANNWGQLIDAVMQFEHDLAQEIIFLLGDTIDFSDDVSTIYDARFTTCRPPQTAGYYLYGKRIDIFPGDRMVIRSVRFVESGLTLFYWPYIAIPLDQSRPTRIHFPEVGYSETDGYYVRTRFSYDGPGDGFGDVLVEASQFGGVGAGVDHFYRYRPEDNSEGRLFVYGKTNSGRNEHELTVRWDESFRVGPMLHVALQSLAEARSSYGWAEQHFRNDLRLRYDVGRSSTTLDMTHVYRPSLNQRWTLGSRLNHSQTIQGMRLTGRIDQFLQRTGGQTDHSAFGYLTSVSRSTGGVAWSVRSERRINRSLLTEGGSRAPAWRMFLTPFEADVMLRLRDMIDERLPVELRLAHGRYMEERRIGTEYDQLWADKTSFGFGVVPRPLHIGSRGSLTYRADVRHDRYTTGHSRNIFTVNHQYRLPVGERSTFFLTYAMREVTGDNSPFNFDRVSAQDTLRGRFQYMYARGSVNVSAGHNFRTGLPTDVLGQFTLRPSQRLSMELQAGYSPIQQSMTYVAGNVNATPVDGLRISTSARYDARASTLDRVSASLALDIAHWYFEYAASYDGRRDEYDLGSMMIRRDLDCRQIALRYDLELGSTWLEYSITAFPQIPIGIGFDDGQVSIDSSAWFH